MCEKLQLEAAQRWTIATVIAVMLAAAWGSAAAQGAAPALSESAAWGVVQSPNAGSDPGNLLNAVSVLSSTDIWAVGSYGDLVHPHPQVQRWNGERWTQVTIPRQVREAELFGVAAIAADDVWIVGGYNVGGHSLVLHWDGTTLAVVPSPNPGGLNRFYAVTAVTANDVWAVGEFTSPISRPLVAHWDGTAWNLVPAPTSANNYTTLYGVDAISSSDIWAVGVAGNHAFALHWNGQRWQKVPAGALGNFATLYAVSGVAANDVWAVGDGANGSIAAHWDGAVWAVVPSPHPGDTFESLDGVTALAANDVWAVGFADDHGSFFTMTIHWDGLAWTLVPSGNTHPSYNQLHGVAAASPAQIWSVGEGDGTLVESWDGAQWNVVPSSNRGRPDNDLTSISALGESDIWAVGSADTDSLTEHWNGASWSVVPSPNLEFGAPLEGVVAIAHDDVWAVGSSGDAGGLDSKAIAMHWDGSQWSIVPTPQPGRDSVDVLHAVDAVASDDVYAVGEYWDSQIYSRASIVHWNGSTWTRVQNGCNTYGPLHGIDVLSATDIWVVGDNTSCHYDGTNWFAVPLDPSGGSVDRLYDVVAIAPDDAWTVGQSIFCIEDFCYGQAYAAHWDGASWTKASVPGATLSDSLYGIVALASKDVWAVGTYGVGARVVHWDGAAWTAVPTPDPAHGGSLNGIAASSPSTLWAAGDFYDSADTLSTLIEQTPSATQGAVIGDTHAGATVTWLGPTRGSAVADSFGNYAAAGLAAGTYRFVASDIGCTPDVAPVEVIAGETVTQDLRPRC